LALFLSRRTERFLGAAGAAAQGATGAGAGAGAASASATAAPAAARFRTGFGFTSAPPVLVPPPPPPSTESRPSVGAAARTPPPAARTPPPVRFPTLPPPRRAPWRPGFDAHVPAAAPSRNAAAPCMLSRPEQRPLRPVVRGNPPKVEKCFLQAGLTLENVQRGVALAPQRLTVFTRVHNRRARHTHTRYLERRVCQPVWTAP